MDINPTELIVILVIGIPITVGISVLINKYLSSKSAKESIGISDDDLQKIKDAQDDRMKSTMEAVVTSAVTDIFTKTSAQLTKQNVTEIGLHSKHIKSIQQAVDESLKTFQTEQSKYSSKLVVNVEDLTGYTRNLSEALRSTKGSGQWGEMQLQRVAELGGMLEHCDFETQKAMNKNDGRRPDMMVFLPSPDKRPSGRIAVDSKAPMANFMAANEAKDKRTQEASLKEWKKALRKHVDELSSKQYWDSFKEPVELVVMFLPGEAMFSAAHQVYPELIGEASEKKVVVASPITLISLLRTFAYGWRQVVLVEKAEEIRKTSKGLFDSLVSYREHLAKMGTSLGQTVKTFNKGVRSWEGNVSSQGDKLLDLKISTVSKENVHLEEIDERPREIDTPNTSDDN
jgi:DNA anti-recombination protein RmuC